MTPAKLRPYAGLKEEYYLADFEPDPAVLRELGLSRERPLAVVRTPPAVSLYHRFEAPVFTEVLHKLKGEQVVVLPRTPEQRAELAREGGFIVPEQAIDAQSLIAFADLVISGRRDDEPRGGRARHAGLDDVRGTARRGRRASDRRRPDAAAHERRRGRARAPRRRCGGACARSAATPRSSRICS